MLPTQTARTSPILVSILRSQDVVDEPVAFRLLGEDIVVWRTEDGSPAALQDRCCHRTAKLSRGFCLEGRVVCGYHGWRYDREGRVVRVPQVNAERDARSAMRTQAYHAAERYGHSGSPLGDPISPIPDLEEEDNPDFRRVHQFYHKWSCGGLRFMENSFDTAHVAIVHRGTFGDMASPKPAPVTLERHEDGFIMRAEVSVVNGDLQKRGLGLNTDETTRSITSRWFMPFLPPQQLPVPQWPRSRHRDRFRSHRRRQLPDRPVLLSQRLPQRTCPMKTSCGSTQPSSRRTAIRSRARTGMRRSICAATRRPWPVTNPALLMREMLPLNFSRNMAKREVVGNPGGAALN